MELISLIPISLSILCLSFSFACSWFHVHTLQHTLHALRSTSIAIIPDTVDNISTSTNSSYSLMLPIPFDKFVHVSILCFFFSPSLLEKGLQDLDGSIDTDDIFISFVYFVRFARSPTPPPLNSISTSYYYIILSLLSYSTYQYPYYSRV